MSSLRDPMGAPLLTALANQAIQEAEKDVRRQIAEIVQPSVDKIIDEATSAIVSGLTASIEGFRDNYTGRYEFRVTLSRKLPLTKEPGHE